jgi:hypothetical protein
MMTDALEVGEDLQRSPTMARVVSRVTNPGQSRAVIGWIGLPRAGEIVRKVGDSGVLLSPVDSSNLAHNPKVAGSNPAPATSSAVKPRMFSRLFLRTGCPNPQPTLLADPVCPPHRAQKRVSSGLLQFDQLLSRSLVDERAVITYECDQRTLTRPIWRHRLVVRITPLAYRCSGSTACAGEW